MTDYKIAQGQDETCTRWERLETDELLAIVDQALSYVSDRCQVCGGGRDGDKRLVAWLYHHKMLHRYVLLEMACPECGG